MPVVRVLIDHPDERVAARGRLLAALLVSFVVVTAVLATLGRSWSWTGFQGNETVWEWLDLLAQPVALLFVLVELIAPPDPRRVVLWLAVTGGALAVLMVGGYGLHWQWTGFDEYRLWDWLHLLVLPVILVLLPVWLRSGAEISARARWTLTAIATVLTASFVGGYAWHWAWTGCAGKTFRDWLNLLITPFVLPVVCKWLVATHNRAVALSGGAEALLRPASPAEPM